MAEERIANRTVAVSATQKFQLIKQALVDMESAHLWQTHEWPIPSSAADIYLILEKEGITPKAIVTAYAKALKLPVYDQSAHGAAVQTYGKAFITSNQILWVPDPFGPDLAELQKRKSQGLISYISHGIYIKTSTDRSASGFENETELDEQMNQVIEAALDRDATDIHIRPRNSNTLQISFRVDGHLRTYNHKIKMESYAGFSNRLKNRVGGYGGEITKPDSQKFTYPYKGREVQIRFEVRPVVINGVNKPFFVLRLLNNGGAALSLEQIGFENHHYQMILDICHRSQGLFLVTGPTGSGKTTTLYAILKKIRELRPGDSIQTLEDPVEVEIPGIEQTAMSNENEMTFATGLRSALRSDPEAILIGEIRDLETAEMAITAAATGHLVLATLHTNSAASTINRLIGLKVNKVALADALVAITAQRIVRKVCQHCKQSVPFSENKEWVHNYSGMRQTPGPGDTVPMPSKGGCDKCEGGFKGRHVVCEIMMVDNATQSKIVTEAPASEIESAHIEKGFDPLWGHGISLVSRGVTTIPELETRLQPRASYGDRFDYNDYNNIITNRKNKLTVVR